MGTIPRGQKHTNGDKSDLEPEIIEGSKSMMDYLACIGPCTSDGDSFKGVSYQEIQAYQNLTGTFFSPWQVETLFKMSNAAAKGINTGLQPNSNPPFVEISLTDRAKSAQDKIFG